MDPFNFNELPEVIRQLFEKVERIELLLEKLEPKEENDSDLLNIEEAATFLKVSVAALYTKVSRKEIPVSKPGRRLYFNKTELKAWINQSQRKTLKDLMSGHEQTAYQRFRPAIRRPT